MPEFDRAHRPETVINLPNGLSMYRLVITPAIVYAIVSGQRMLFAVLVIVNLLTDILDGYLARKWNQQTALGARLDSVGDLATCILAVSGMILLERDFFVAHRAAFVTLVTFYFLPQIFSFLRFRHLVSLHLYSSKLTAYAQGAFFASYFFLGYSAIAFYCVVCIGILNNIEELIVVSLIPDYRSNLRGVCWLAEDLARGRQL